MADVELLVWSTGPAECRAAWFRGVDDLALPLPPLHIDGVLAPAESIAAPVVYGAETRARVQVRVPMTGAAARVGFRHTCSVAGASVTFAHNGEGPVWLDASFLPMDAAAVSAACVGTVRGAAASRPDVSASPHWQLYVRGIATQDAEVDLVVAAIADAVDAHPFRCMGDVPRTGAAARFVAAVAQLSADPHFSAIVGTTSGSELVEMRDSTRATWAHRWAAMASPDETLSLLVRWVSQHVDLLRFAREELAAAADAAAAEAAVTVACRALSVARVKW